VVVVVVVVVLVVVVVVAAACVRRRPTPLGCCCCCCCCCGRAGADAAAVVGVVVAAVVARADGGAAASGSGDPGDSLSPCARWKPRTAASNALCVVGCWLVRCSGGGGARQRRTADGERQGLVGERWRGSTASLRRRCVLESVVGCSGHARHCDLVARCLARGVSESRAQAQLTGTPGLALVLCARRAGVEVGFSGMAKTWRLLLRGKVEWRRHCSLVLVCVRL